MLRLLQFSRDRPRETVSPLIVALSEVEHDGISGSGRPSLTGAHFERFFATWLQLIAVVRRGEPLTVLRLFHADGVGGLQEGAPAELTSAFTLDHVKPKPASKLTFSEAAIVDAELGSSDSIMTFRFNNPAFDILVAASAHPDGPSGAVSPTGKLTSPSSPPTRFTSAARPVGRCVTEPTPRASYVALAIGARMSDAGSRTVDAAEDVSHKVGLFESFRPAFRHLSVPPAHVAYVYAAARPVANVAALQRKMAARGVLVLGNTESGDTEQSLATVGGAFTPTLSDRAFFLLRFRG